MGMCSAPAKACAQRSETATCDPTAPSTSPSALLALERSGAVGRTVPGWTVVASSRGTEIGPTAAAVAPRRDVEQRRQVRVRVRSVVDRALVASQGIDPPDNRGRDAGPAEDEPPTGL